MGSQESQDPARAIQKDKRNPFGQLGSKYQHLYVLGTVNIFMYCVLVSFCFINDKTGKEIRYVVFILRWAAG